MKKVILSLALVVAGVVGVNAQTPSTSTKVKLNVVLNPVLAIEIGNSDAANTGETIPSGYDDVVTLEYKNATDYTTGVSKTVDGQLKVTSIGSDFKVYAQTSTNNLTRVSGGNETMEGDLVTIAIGSSAEKNVRDLVSQQDYGTITGKSTTAKSLDVTYRAAALNDTKLADLLRNNNNNKVTYTTDVIYTVVPQ